MIEAKGKKDIGERINIIISKLAEANDLKGVIDRTDFDDSEKLGKEKEKVDRLTKLVAIFENPNLDFSKNKSGGDDILGDVYEYFMKHFASESGKSKGQFYTPAEVSRIMAQIIGVEKATSADQTAYDMACGSGSLLLKVDSESPVDITLYGQEKDIAVSVLAKMNMILHGKPTAEIRNGNTLTDPKFKEGEKLKTFDFCVANPPFADKAWMTGLDPDNDEFHRFDDGVPPVKTGDYAFILHFIKSLKHTGKGAIILPHGVLFRGNSEAGIRRNLIKKGYIKGIIGLPANLFFGTGIPAVIIIIDKENAINRKGIFMVDASKGFIKDGNKNKLREQDIHRIVDTVVNQKKDEKYSRMVTLSEIKKNEYNLNLPRYIDTSEEEDIQDICAHLHGGIPNVDIEKMEEYWTEFSTLKEKLFDKKDEFYSNIKIKEGEIADIIFENNEFKDFRKKAQDIFKKWKDGNISKLQNINGDTNAKEFIKDISNDLLSTFKSLNLLDEYAVYQYSMNYWDEVMQDDVYIIIDD
ncbi:MAG: type I restriction-modification system subunit M, partial [Candidatus Cloacimonadota bacterium]|nr:type I restriction-modification system subunit M [Candidatus Cloacimonadota bacterium]